MALIFHFVEWIILPKGRFDDKSALLPWQQHRTLLSLNNLILSRSNNK